MNTDQSRIIPDGISFPRTMKVAVNQLDSFQPVQDRFAYIESTDIEDDLGQLPAFWFQSKSAVDYQYEN